MGERVATVNLPRILENIALQRDDVSWGPNSTFRFPLHGGTGAIWSAVRQLLPAERICISIARSRASTRASAASRPATGEIDRRTTR